MDRCFKDKGRLYWQFYRWADVDECCRWIGSSTVDYCTRSPVRSHLWSQGCRWRPSCTLSRNTNRSQTSTHRW